MGESENLSKRGILFATDSVIAVGTTLEIFLKMPETINGESANEWLYSGHVVRVEPSTSTRGHFGVVVQFDCYQVSGGNEEGVASLKGMNANPEVSCGSGKNA